MWGLWLSSWGILGHAADELAGAKIPSDVADTLRPCASVGHGRRLSPPGGSKSSLRPLFVQPARRSSTCSAHVHAPRLPRAVQTATEADEALRAHAPLTGLLPFASLFYGQASHNVYRDEDGVGHEVLQGEGGEQGEPLMPGLYTLGQHAALFTCIPNFSRERACMHFWTMSAFTSPPERTLPAFVVVPPSQRPGTLRHNACLERSWQDASRASGSAAFGGRRVAAMLVATVANRAADGRAKRQLSAVTGFRFTEKFETLPHQMQVMVRSCAKKRLDAQRDVRCPWS